MIIIWVPHTAIYVPMPMVFVYVLENCEPACAAQLACFRVFWTHIELVVLSKALRRTYTYNVPLSSSPFTHQHRPSAPAPTENILSIIYSMHGTRHLYDNTPIPLKSLSLSLVCLSTFVLNYSTKYQKQGIRQTGWLRSLTEKLCDSFDFVFS